NRGLPGTLIHRYIGGDSILTLNGSDWKRHRKIANKAFNQSMPIKLFGELTLQMFDTIDNLGSTVEVADLFQRLTIDVIGFHFNSLVDRDNKWVSYYNSVKEGMLHPFFVVFPLFDSTLLRFFPKRQKIHDNLTEFTNMMDTIIEDKRKQLLAEKLDQDTVKDQSERDLLTLMLESENDEQVVLSNEELRNNLCIFFLAGHDTTSFSLSFMIYELAKNQDLQEKARKEALEILGNDHRDNLPTAEQTKNMTFINAVMKETMRLHPAVNTTTVREVTEDCHLGEIFIPKGTQVASDIINLHHCGKLWRNPHEFNPDRFLPGGEYEQHASSGLTWIPFSAGGRICVGMNFSLAEQRVVLSMLCKYKLHFFYIK
ncbi:cytochrome P450, partial [Cunninghamella echinulata]